MKKRKYKINENEFGELMKMGYTVARLSPWHYRLTRFEGEKTMDVFPTTKTYTIKTAEFFSKGKPYAQLIDTAERELDSFSQPTKKWYNGHQAPAEKESAGQLRVDTSRRP